MVSDNSGIKRPADAEAAVGPSVQTDVFHIDGLMRDILEMTISPGDFKAMVRACAPRTQWPVYRKIFTQRETRAKVAAMMDTTLFAPFNQWCIEKVQEGKEVDAEAKEEYIKHIKGMASSLESLAKLALCASSVSEINRCFRPKLFLKAYDAIYHLCTGLPRAAGEGLSTQIQNCSLTRARIYAALTTFQAILADGLFHMEAHRPSTAWAHYLQVVECTKGVGTYIERADIRDHTLPSITQAGLKSGATVLRARFSAEVLEAEGLTQVVAEHAGPVQA